MAGYQKKTVELIKLVTHCNLTYEHEHTNAQHNRLEQRTKEKSSSSFNKVLDCHWFLAPVSFADCWL